MNLKEAKLKSRMKIGKAAPLVLTFKQKKNYEKLAIRTSLIFDEVSASTVDMSM